MTDAGHRTTSCPAVWPAVALVLAALRLLPAGTGGSGGSRGGSGGTAPATSFPSSGGSGVTSGPAWLVTRTALAELIADPSVRQRLGKAPGSEILQPGQQLLSGVTARAVVTFSSAATLMETVRSGQVPAGAYGVLYDPEHWSFTPLAEQH